MISLHTAYTYCIPISKTSTRPQQVSSLHLHGQISKGWLILIHPANISCPGLINGDAVKLSIYRLLHIVLLYHSCVQSYFQDTPGGKYGLLSFPASHKAFRN